MDKPKLIALAVFSNANYFIPNKGKPKMKTHYFSSINLWFLSAALIFIISQAHQLNAKPPTDPVGPVKPVKVVNDSGMPVIVDGQVEINGSVEIDDTIPVQIKVTNDCTMPVPVEEKVRPFNFGFELTQNPNNPNEYRGTFLSVPPGEIASIEYLTLELRCAEDCSVSSFNIVTEFDGVATTHFPAPSEYLEFQIEDGLTGFGERVLMFSDSEITITNFVGGDALIRGSITGHFL